MSMIIYLLESIFCKLMVQVCSLAMRNEAENIKKEEKCIGSGNKSSKRKVMTEGKTKQNNV